MTHTYHISGMTCSGCENTVKSNLLKVNHILNVDVSKDSESARITMDQHIPIQDLQKSLGSKYQISANQHNETAEQAKSWLVTYKPILLIFLYITIVTFAIQISQSQFDFMQWMRHFMAGFFLVFSFFKLLDLRAFSESYRMYDVVAAKIPIWGWVYPFVELGLGISYILNFNPFVTNLITLIVMSVSIIGVLQSVLYKRKIQCACLGAVFNLPMSTVTIIEDFLMILMSLWMLLML